MSVYKNLNIISKSGLKHEVIRKVLYATTMSKGWTSKRVIPDVLDSVPARKLGVQYPVLNINEGNIVKPDQVKSQPQVSWKPDDGLFYTLCMSDLDAPSREKPLLREWLHWLVVNIPENNVDRGEVLAEYIGAGPPQHTGLHRYVFALFEYVDKKTYSQERLTSTSAQGRQKFSIRKFSDKYNLGTPIAGNFFEAEYDDYVPKLHKQLGI